MKRVGLDLGERYVGVAVHDDPDVPARPVETIDRRVARALIEALAAVVSREGAAEVVIGLPLHMDGREGASARNARRVAEALERRSSAKVVLWDERLTTTQAQRNRVARGTRGREGIDAEAAALLLQSYVDAARGGSGWDPDAEP